MGGGGRRREKCRERRVARTIDGMLGQGLDCCTYPLGTDPLREETASVFEPPGPHGDGTPLFLLPGFGLDGRSFAPLAPLAAQRRVVFWNPPNRMPSGDDLVAVGERALRDAERAGCGTRLVLGGASFGGMLALRTALEWPDRVAGLVLFGSAACWGDVSLPVRMASVLHDAVPRRRYPQLLAKALVPARYDPKEGSPLNDALRGQMRLRTQAYGRRLLRALRRHDVRERLTEIAVPTLVVHGAQDEAIPPAAARTLARIPSSTVIVWDRAGHLPVLSNPRGCIDALLPFLAEVDRASGGRRA